jgi:hypothetical protein
MIKAFKVYAKNKQNEVISEKYFIDEEYANGERYRLDCDTDENTSIFVEPIEIYDGFGSYKKVEGK